MGIQQLLDVAFVGLVLFTCWHSLFGSSSRRRAYRWKEELRDLEDMLRELIAEAGAASSSLDRSLSRRKEELSALIRKIETAKQGAENSVAARSAAPAAQRRVPAPRRTAAEVEDTLPNRTWESSSAEPGRATLAETIEELLEEDHLSVSRPATPEKQSLAKKIEMKRESDILSEKGFVGESIDPVAYKIALRLLSNGQEIHIVARKLGLPMAEVRLIDRLRRSKAGEIEIEEVETQPAHVVRATAESQRSELKIERETALL